MEYIRHLRVERGKTWPEVGRDFNKAFRSSTASLKTIQKTFRKFVSEEDRVPKIEQIEDTVDDLMYDTVEKENNKLIQELKKEKVKTQQFIEAITTAISKRKIKTISPPKFSTTPKDRDLQMHVLRSDAQVGEVVEPHLTSGLGKYDYTTYMKRVRKLTEKVITFQEQDKRSLGLRKLVIPMLGDQVEGESVYKGQVYHIDRPLIDQLFDSAYFELNNFLLPLAQRFPEVEIYCVMGNHGRTGRKGEFHSTTNWDYLFYKTVQILLAQAAPHVKIFTTKSPTMIVQHGKFLFSYNHGDDVRGWNGIPYYGLNRMASRVGDMHRTYIDYHCCGHFHTASNLGGRILINGTLVGGSDLSINSMHLTSLPSQKMFYFHPEHGINRESDLHLDTPIKLKPDQNRIYTPID